MKTILAVFLLFLAVHAGEPQRPSSSVQSSTTWKFFDANTLRSTIADDGPYNDYRRTGSAGLTWPKGSIAVAVFTSGLIVVGRHRSSGLLRTSGQYYFTEYQPGPITGTFNTATNNVSVGADRNDTTYRTYKISSGDTELSNPDYAHWPGNLGAPYNDQNGNGVWDPGTDTPRLFGDQTLWQVINDLDTAAHKKVGTTAPMGLEIRTMYYGFDRPGALGNTMFIKWTIINKSDASYDSTFFGLFSDVDMGDASDDIDGYDTTRALAYVYNGDNDDLGESGYGSTPPSVGTAFLGGRPTVTPYAYPVWVKSFPEINDLPMANPEYPQNAFDYCRGLTKMGTPNINPLTQQPARFAFTGDPVANTGWLKVNYWNPADVRSFLSVGPVTLAPGDTQEVNAAVIIARSSDRLASLAMLRQYTDTVRSAFADNFVTAVADNARQPEDYRLEQNYPNPFNPSTTITFRIPERSTVRLSIYNILGQKISEIVNETKDIGSYEQSFNALQLASGIYFYRIEATSVSHSKTFVETKKMILIK